MDTTTAPQTTTSLAGALDDALVERFRRSFDNERSYRLMQNAVTKVGVNEVALDRSVVTSIDHTFSHKLDDWFDEHMFEIAARKHYLPAELLTALEEEPIVLPAWDPMGSLAG